MPAMLSEKTRQTKATCLPCGRKTDSQGHPSRHRLAAAGKTGVRLGEPRCFLMVA